VLCCSLKYILSKLFIKKNFPVAIFFFSFFETRTDQNSRLTIFRESRSNPNSSMQDILRFLRAFCALSLYDSQKIEIFKKHCYSQAFLICKNYKSFFNHTRIKISHCTCNKVASNHLCQCCFNYILQL
jgi:hypothetical protein